MNTLASNCNPLTREIAPFDLLQVAALKAVFVVNHRLKVQLFFLLLTSYYLTSPRVQVEVSTPRNLNLLFLFSSSFDIYRLLYAEFYFPLLMGFVSAPWPNNMCL
jgi:hypothetical protein